MIKVSLIVVLLSIPTLRSGFAAEPGNAKADPYVSALANLKSQDPALRSQAAQDLGRLRNSQAVPKLVEALSKDDVPSVRRKAAKALGVIADPKALNALKQALGDPDALTRLNAAAALGRLGDFSGEAEAIRLLADKDASTRQQAAITLGIVGSKENALPALRRALASERDASSKQVIGFALDQLKARFGIKEKSR